jgi:hypothetical protein
MKESSGGFAATFQLFRESGSQGSTIETATYQQQAD